MQVRFIARTISACLSQTTLTSAVMFVNRPAPPQKGPFRHRHGVDQLIGPLRRMYKMPLVLHFYFKRDCFWYPFLSSTSLLPRSIKQE
ncbi:hypothetical protein BKA65DRAFT_521302 [Rhexocercosporidium sp. MPI-PUGE-AT-0058]|nr:hypothetical protein BKA65DRAFT_521302 [Rhexocercosporidium sp. MPI-PUGE-AT-0058]